MPAKGPNDPVELSGGISLPPVTVTPREFLTREVTHRTLKMREVIVWCMLGIFGFLILMTTVFFLFQGFHLWGFSLPESLLQWLGGATIGEVAGLIALSITSFLKKEETDL